MLSCCKSIRFKRVLVLALTLIFAMGLFSIAPSTAAGTGQITREVWENIGSGTAVSVLTSNANYPNNPTSTGTLTSFEAPTDVGSNYGQRIHGYLNPTVSGSYEFWIASDDTSELWLSTNDSPSNVSLIAKVTGWTDPRQWSKYTEQHSASITLTAGQAYYIMALMKEESNGDNLSVAWKAPGGSQEVIPGSYLSPYSGTPVNNVSAPGFSPAPGTYTSAQTVTISSATSGASIRYTTDGSTPTATTGTVYSAPITISSTTTLKAIAYKSGMTDSSVTTGTYTISTIVSAPVFSPAAGTYTSAQTVTISSATSGASIRYTTDGSTPTASTGTVYSAPITLSSTTTLKAIAYKSGMTNSSVTSGTYTITSSTGTGQITREVWENIGNGTAVSVLTSNANYPNNPTSTGTLTSFEAPTDVGSNYGQRIHGYLNPTVSGSYEFWIASDDNSELWLSTSSSPSNASLIAKVTAWTDPRQWSKYSEQHSASITLTAGQAYYVMALMKEEGNGDNLSVAWKAPGGSQEVIPGSYLSPYSGTPVNNVSAPGFSPAPGTYTSAQTVTINSATSGASIRYTTDGSTPTATTGTVYSAPITLSSTTTLKAIAYKSGMTDSSVTTGTYTINTTVSAPGFSPAAGTYTSAQTVTISSATSGASIRYTTDGSTPTASTGTVYSAPITLSSTTTLKAIAYKSGMTNSSVTSGTYTINIAVSAPGFSPAAGSYSSAQTVTISSATSGASIRYTTDGSTPTSSTGTVYSSPITIGSTTTLKAIAYKSGMPDSSVTTGIYTIGGTSTPPPSTLYPFAMCSNSNILSNSDYSVKMLNAGAKMYRVDVPFPSVRPRAGNDPNTWDWSVPNAIRSLKQQHPELEVLPILGYGASWAVDPAYQGLPDLTSINSPQNGVNILPAQSSGNLFGNYVYEMVSRYKDIIHYWESWNEPDLPGYAFFRGSGKEFFAYQRACYLAAKAADPNCKVLFPGLSYASIEGYLYTHNLEEPTPYPPATSFFEEYLKECIKDPNAAANNYYFDIMNQHSYSRASDLYDYTAINSKLMQDYLGSVKPVWITEMGGLDAGPGMFSATPAEYCDYILQSFAWGSLAGVERFFHFQLDNSNGHGLYDGMLGSPKPALTTYRDVLAKEFADVEFYQQLYGTKGVNFLAGNSAFNPTWKAGYNAFEFRNGSGSKRVIMAFTDKAQAVSNVKIPATAGKTAVLIDRNNNRTAITASGGYYTINLGAATNISGWPVDSAYAYMGQPENMIGGPTLVIVEQ